jgi:hypothetical protein
MATAAKARAGMPRRTARGARDAGSRPSPQTTGAALAQVQIVLVAFEWFVLTTWPQRRAQPDPGASTEHPDLHRRLMMPPIPHSGRRAYIDQASHH